MNAHIKRLWVDDLSMTTAPQAQLTLFDGIGYCCLGRLCELHRIHTGEGEWKVRVYVPGNNIWEYVPSTGDPEETKLPIAVMKWAGLSDIDPVIGNNRRASNHNDILKKTFKEISDLIRANVSEQVL